MPEAGRDGDFPGTTCLRGMPWADLLPQPQAAMNEEVSDAKPKKPHSELTLRAAADSKNRLLYFLKTQKEL